MEDLTSITDHLRLLGDPTRLRVLHLLKLEELTVGELAASLSQGQSTISAHLARLREAGLVLDRRDGTRAYYRWNAIAAESDGPSFWDLCDGRLSGDSTLIADRDRMEQVVLARQQGSWLDRAAGSLDRRYVPGRSFESLALAFASLLDLGDCIDMGSGDGALLEWLVPASKSLVCLDNHAGMVESGQQRIAAGKYETAKFLLGDMHDPPLEPSSADTVLFVQSLQYAAKPALALAAATRILRPGGRCLVLTLGPHGDRRISTEYGHLHGGFAVPKLRKLLQSADLEVVRCDRVGHDSRSPQLPIVLAVALRP
ncbi:MAG: metalloregulator ArsR/SmtB family transcription factor [Planctomycetes bacterium]|nr:metalloregulator ArsR/SmtB family transcription factor [Planctomycetota bacterium]